MRFVEIELRSSDPEAQIAFYAGVLGLPVEGGVVRAGATRIRFSLGEAPAYHLAFNIPENQIRSGKGWIADRAPLLSDEIFDFDFWNAHAVYFEDHDHNILELIARHTLPNATDAEFGPLSLLEVSEVGVASDSPNDLVHRLESELALPFYSGDCESFTAIGDEHGLFIVVAAGREWLPTKIPAAPAFTHVTIEARAVAEFDFSPEPLIVSTAVA